jgi:hypothetical protein
VAADTPGRVYVITASYGPYGSELGFYRSDDGEDSFAAATKANGGGDIWWTGKVWVDPQDGKPLFAPNDPLKCGFSVIQSKRRSAARGL